MAALDLCDADDGPGTRDRRGETIVIDRATNDGEDYALERLVDGDIFVLGAIRALRAYDLRRCRVYVLAIAGSALVENIVDSVVCVATRQLRVHAARRTNFHVRATSRPIVEDSREIAFAPRFSIESPNEEEVLKAHGLFEGSSRSLRGSHLSTAATTNARFDVRAPFFRRRFVRETFLAAVPLAATRTQRHRDIFFQTFIAVRASAADVANDEKIRAFSAKTSFRASTVRGAQAQLIWIVLRAHSLLTSIAKERVVAPRARLQHAVRATIAMLAK